MTQTEVRTKRCGICRKDFPATYQNFYRNGTEPGGFSRCCKGCADAAKKRYKAKYNRNRQERQANVKPRTSRLTDRVQYALLTHRCPRCGGRLQRYLDDYDRSAPCMACMMCSREVWLPKASEVERFVNNPPPAVAMPAWVQRDRRRKKRGKRR
jgi:hypothetical protein